MTDETLVRGELRLAGRLDARFFALLDAIDTTGSINRAARTAGYSYRGAWLVLETAADLANEPLIDRAVGGTGGGGSRLTSAARALMAAWHQISAAHADFLKGQEAWILQQPSLIGVLRRMSVRATARNQFGGRISAVDWGPVTSQATVAMRGGQEVTATMTTRAARRLGIRPDREAIVLIKSSEIDLVTDLEGYALSARNQLDGTISRVERGAVSSTIGLTLPGGSTITASVESDAVDECGFVVGRTATAVFDAYSVMLAVARA
jgi:molybdate transport system regulatory protein